MERTVKEWTNEDIDSTSLEHAYNDRFDALTMIYRVTTTSDKVFHNFQYMDYDTYDEKYRYKFGKDNDRYLKLFLVVLLKEKVSTICPIRKVSNTHSSGINILTFLREGFFFRLYVK